MTNFYKDWCVPPGAVLKEWCEEHGMTHEAAAIGCRHMKLETFQDILTGHVPITPQLAGALQAGTAVGAKVWLNLERQYRESLAAGNTSP